MKMLYMMFFQGTGLTKDTIEKVTNPGNHENVAHDVNPWNIIDQISRRKES